MAKIFVVENEDSVRSFCRRSLVHNYEVHDATTCIEALTKVPEVNPDLLVLGCRNIGLHGYNLLEIFLSMDPEYHVPTLVISGDPDDIITLKAVYFAQRMFTPEQRARLGIGYADNLHDLKAEQILTPSYKGFLRKPFGHKNLLESVAEILAVTQSKQV